MNSSLNDFCFENLRYNLSLFKRRFPCLYESFNFGIIAPDVLLKKIPAGYGIEPSKEDLLTLKVKDKFLHSRYNPLREADKMFQSLQSSQDGKDFSYGRIKHAKEKFCFFGLGLGYLQEMYIKENKETQVIIVEPDIFIFILFLSSRKLDSFFSHKKLVIIPGTPPDETLSILENIGIKDFSYFEFKAAMEVSADWFSKFKMIESRKKEKDKLNLNTLKKFNKLWLRNFFKNIEYVYSLKSIDEFKNLFSGFPVLVAAAGPGLEKQLQVIKRYQDFFVIIAVDTALKICIENGIKPDFSILMDAQYWNYLHVAGVCAPETVLITEASVYPAVFRLNFKKIFLCLSFFPLGRYIENAAAKKDELSAGGSVATTAWDFAAYVGAQEIVMAGLDLAFTGKKSHCAGCRFEKENLITADKFLTAEFAAHRALFSAIPETADGYSGKVITDMRLKMYAWWFESKLAENGKPATFNLMSEGLAIPNMPNLNLHQFAEKAAQSKCTKKLKQSKIEKAVLKEKIVNRIEAKERTKKLLLQIQSELKNIYTAAEKAECICRKMLTENSFPENRLKRLEEIDTEIASSELNPLIGFELIINSGKEKKLHPIAASLEVYTEIKKAVFNVNSGCEIFLQDF